MATESRYCTLRLLHFNMFYDELVFVDISTKKALFCSCSLTDPMNKAEYVSKK